MTAHRIADRNGRSTKKQPKASSARAASARICSTRLPDGINPTSCVQAIRTADIAPPEWPAYRADSTAVTPARGDLAEPLAPALDALIAAQAETFGDQLDLTEGEAQTRD